MSKGLPCVSPYGFGLTVSPELTVVVLSLLGSGVVATVNVLSEIVVLVVVATVVLETLVVCVVLASTLPSSSLMSVPVGPQSINPGMVVVRPSWDLSKLSHLSSLRTLSRERAPATPPRPLLVKAAGASTTAAEGSPVSIWEFLKWHSLHAACSLRVGFRRVWARIFDPILTLLSWLGGTRLGSRWASVLSVLQWSFPGESHSGCQLGRERGTDLGVTLIPSPWLRGLHMEKSRVRWVMASRIHTRCPTQPAGLAADGLQRETRQHRNDAGYCVLKWSKSGWLKV